MNHNKILSWLFVILAIVVMVGGIFVLVSYGSDVINIIVNFVTTTDAKKFAAGGVAIPPEFAKIRTDAPTLTFGLYYGAPLLMLLISLLMFLAGFFYSKGRVEDETKKKEEIEREMIRKAAERVARQKAKEAEEAAAKAMEEELEKKQPEQQSSQPLEAEQEPASNMIVRKKKR